MESSLQFAQFRASLKSDGKLIAMGLVLALPILAFDLLYPLGVAVGVPYVVLVLICLKAKSPASAYLMATLGSVLITLGYFLSPEGGIQWVVLTNRGLAVFAIWTVVLFSTRKIEETRKREIAEDALRAIADALDRRVVERTADLEHALTSLQESEARFGQVFRKGPLGIGIVGLDYNLMVVNERFCAMVEYSEEELIGRSFRDITHPDDIEKGLRIRKKAFAGETDHYRLEKRYISKTGKTIWANLTSSVVRNSEGEPLYSIGMVEDITERKRAEQEALRQKAESERYLDVVGNMVVALDRQGDIIVLNRAGHAVLEHEESSAIGLNWFDNFVPENERDMVHAAFLRMIKGEVEHLGEFANNVLTAKGNKRMIRWLNVTLHDGQRNITGTLSSGEDITELQLSHKRLVDAQRLASMGHFEWDAESGVVFRSDAIYRLFGRSAETMAPGYKGFMECVHPDDQDRVEATFNKMLKQECNEAEFRIVLPSGEVRHIHEVIKVELGENDRAKTVRGTIQDITERRRIEEELRNSEAKYRTIVDTANEGFWRVNEEMRIVEVNDAMCRMIGYQREEILGKRPVEFSDHNESPELEELLEEGLRQRLEASTWEGRFVRKDGSRLDVHVAATSFSDPDGNASGRFAFFTDITQRKQAEKEARESKARLEEILDIAPEAVITVGPDMNVQLFNEGAERIFGYQAEKMIGQSLEVLMPDYFRESHRRYVEDFEQSKETYRLMDRRQEIVGLRKDGSEFPAAASVSKLETGGEKIFTVMLLDITERKMTRDALIEAKHESDVANRAKSEFLASMSHDLRTPLNAILGFADMINHQYFGPVSDKYREYAVDIRTSGAHLLALLSEILDLSEIEAGKKSLSEEVFDLGEVISECKMLVSQKAISDGIKLSIKLPMDQLHLFADRRAVMQILLNLLSNAVKFTPRGGSVILSVDMTEEETVIEVADTGKGIDPRSLLEITEPFVCGEYSPYLTKDGWGLGLTIVESLVDLLSGEFDIQSQVGRGTTITITLPTGCIDQANADSAAAV